MSKKEGKVVFIESTPTTPKVWDALVKGEVKAVVLGAYGSGSVATDMIQRIHDAVKKEVAVFLLIQTKRTAGLEGASSAGIVSINYGIQEDALNAGAVHLESANLGQLASAYDSTESVREKDDVLETIAGFLDGSKDMFDLIQKVREVYNLTDEEIAVLEEHSKTDSAPITREQILDARRKIDEMLIKLRQEISEGAQNETRSHERRK